MLAYQMAPYVVIGNRVPFGIQPISQCMFTVIRDINYKVLPSGTGVIRHCISVLEASLLTLVRFQAMTTGRDRESHKAAHN